MHINESGRQNKYWTPLVQNRGKVHVLVNKAKGFPKKAGNFMFTCIGVLQIILFGSDKRYCILEKGQLNLGVRIPTQWDVVDGWVRNLHNLRGVTKSVKAVL
jgi:hypothetical protein